MNKKRPNNEQELNRTLNNANRHVIFYWARLIRCRSQCVVTFILFFSLAHVVYVIWTCCWRPWFEILSIVCAFSAYCTHTEREDKHTGITRIIFMQFIELQRGPSFNVWALQSWSRTLLSGHSYILFFFAFLWLTIRVRQTHQIKTIYSVKICAYTSNDEENVLANEIGLLHCSPPHRESFTSFHLFVIFFSFNLTVIFFIPFVHTVKCNLCFWIDSGSGLGLGPS